MVYKEEEGRGVRSSKFCPQKFDLLPTATLEAILSMGRHAFFSDEMPLKYLCLADSTGQKIDISSDTWTVGSYFEENGYQPSRHKLYTMYKDSTVRWW